MRRTLFLLVVFAAASLTVVPAAQAQRLFVGLEGSSPPTRSSDLNGFPNVTWTNHYAFDVSGAAATPEGTLYVCNGAFTTRLYEFSLSGTPTLLSTISVDIHAMGYGNGVLYGFSNYASPMGIYSIDPATGQAALVVDLSASGFRFFGLDFNPDDGLLYGYTEYGSPTGLYSIDPETGAANFIIGPIPASNSQGRALAIGNNTVYLAATRGDDDIPLFALDLESGTEWIPFTQPYPQYHSTGGAAWIPDPTTGLNDSQGPRLLLPRIEGIAPNPVRDGTRITWSLASAGPARLDLVDITGRRLTTLEQGSMPQGRHGTLWTGADGSGRRLPAGVYYLRLDAGGSVASAPVLIVR